MRFVLSFLVLLSFRHCQKVSYDQAVCNCIVSNMKEAGLDFEEEMKVFESTLIEDGIIDHTSDSRAALLREVKAHGRLSKIRSYDHLLIEQLGIRTLQYCGLSRMYMFTGESNDQRVNFFKNLERLKIKDYDPVDLSEYVKELAARILDIEEIGQKDQLSNWLFLIYSFHFLQSEEQSKIIQLPPWSEPESFDTIHAVRMDVFKNNTIKIDDTSVELVDVCSKLKEPIFKKNPILLKMEREVDYNFYIEVYREIKSCYAELRNEVAYDTYDLHYEELNQEQQEQVREKIPLLFSEGPPTNFATK